MKETRAGGDNSFTCTIRQLDDSETSIDVTKETLGQVLLNHVCKNLDLIEKDYFGLRFVDNTKQRHWLDTKKEVSKQLKDIRQPFMFFFRVKFYPSDPTKVREDITRYQIYLQLKRDILHGRLLCPFNNITDLAAHIVQAEVGDYISEEHGTTYINGIKLLPRHSDKLEEKIIEYHKTLSGLSPLDAETRFLNLAHVQDLYGVDPHPCKDEEDSPLYLGLTPQGIQIIREAKRVSGFPWRKVVKISHDNRLFYIQIQNGQKKTNYVFRLTDTAACKHLWTCTQEHMSFYGEDSQRKTKKHSLSPQLLFRKSKYKYKGKTENDVLNDAETIKRSRPSTFKRNSSIRLSVNINCAKNSTSLPNLGSKDCQATGELHYSDYDNSNNTTSTVESSNNSTDDERCHDETAPARGSMSRHNDDDHSALAEFETKHFPIETSSSRSSLAYDDISITSSMDMAGTTHSTIPELNDETEADLVYRPKAPRSRNRFSRKPVSARLVVAIYKEPVWLLVLLFLTAVPMAILLQMANVRS